MTTFVSRTPTRLAACIYVLAGSITCWPMGSTEARIRLRRDAETLVLEIEDRGQGIPNAALRHITSGGGGVGVGIAGMTERIEQLSGRLEVASNDHGTTVRVSLSVANSGD